MRPTDGELPKPRNSVALASLYRNQERYSEAMALCREVLQIRKRVLGDEHPDTIESVFQHAVLCRIAKRFDDAARLLNQTLDARRRILGDEHPDTLKSLEQLAMVHWAQRQFRELESIERELLEQRRRRADASPADKNQYAWALLICMSPELRDPQSALRLSLEVNELTGYENTGFLDTLSYAYHQTGDTAKAIENQEKAIALLPPGDTDLRRHMNHKLATYRKALNQADGTAHGVPAGDQP